MNNNYAMSASFEARKNQQATAITAAVAALIVLMMIFLKWAIPTFVQETPRQEMYIDLNLPEEPPPPPARVAQGGGGGGNEVHAPGKAGIAEPSPPNPGTTEDSRDVDDLPADKTSVPVLKPDVPKPDAKKVGENKAPVVPPKPDPKPPAPPRPRHVMTSGQTTNGTSTGGNEATTYERSGGTRGGGNGVGNGPGSGGNTGGGTGGGRGSGVGVTSGDRSVLGSYSFTDDLDKATIYVEVRVSPAGTGQFVQFARGSSSTNSSYREAIIRYLRQIKFNKSDHESTVTVRFNFNVSG
jgi:outer membrane biosynthesis protein TonB